MIDRAREYAVNTPPPPLPLLLLLLLTRYSEIT